MSPNGKIISLPQALARARGARRVALGGWGFSRRPCGIVFGLLAAGTQIEELVVLTGGVETDLLVAARRGGRVRAFYLGLEAIGLGPGLRRGCEVVEETETSLVLGLMAAAQRVSFLPLPARRAGALRDVRSDLRSLRCPYTGEESLAIPPLGVDVAYIHAWRADPYGNVLLGGHKAADRLLAAAASETIVTCEEVVPTVAGEVDLAEPLVAAVVHLPGGARPTGCVPLYGPDWVALIDYARREGQAIDDWLAARAVVVSSAGRSRSG